MAGSFNRMGAAMAGLACAASLFAGGFWIVLGDPEASAEARSLGAVVTLKPVGCHDPAKAEVSGTAVGLVNGHTRSIPLKLTALSQPGMYAVTKQWPSEGTWVIELVGKNQGMVTSVLASAGAGGVDRKSAKAMPRLPTAEERDTLLRAGSQTAAAAKM